MFYACYDALGTDVAEFDTSEDRDGWIKAHEKDSVFGIIKIEYCDMTYICGKNPEINIDPDGVKWLINPYY